MQRFPTPDQIRQLHFTESQVRHHAEQCESKGCPSYIHCYLIPGAGHVPGTVPLPTCAKTVLKAIAGDTK